MVQVDTESSFLAFLEFFAILTVRLAIIRRSSLRTKLHLIPRDGRNGLLSTMIRAAIFLIASIRDPSNFLQSSTGDKMPM